MTLDPNAALQQDAADVNISDTLPGAASGPVVSQVQETATPQPTPQTAQVGQQTATAPAPGNNPNTAAAGQTPAPASPVPSIIQTGAGVVPVTSLTPPGNIVTWATQEAVSIGTSLLQGNMPNGQTVKVLQDALTTLGLSALSMIANTNPSHIEQATQQRALATSQLDDLASVGLRNAAAAAQKSVAKLLADAADFALTGLTKAGL